MLATIHYQATLHITLSLPFNNRLNSGYLFQDKDISN